LRLLRRSLQVVAGLSVIVLAIVWLSGGFGERLGGGKVEPQRGPAPAQDIQHAVVELVSLPAVEWASGTIASARHTEIAARITARIEEVRVRAGDRVTKDDVLVVLDARDLKARVEQAAQVAAAAAAELKRTQQDFARLQRIHREDPGAVARADLERRAAALQSAQAELTRARQAKEEAEAALSYSTIRAPMSGLVIDRLAEPGDTTLPGEPLLRIYDPRALQAQVPVRESLAIRLNVGQTLRVEVPDLAKKLTGKIEEIVPFADPGARTLLVKLGLPPDPQLYAGMFARLAVPSGNRQRLLIPVEAVERIGQLEFVTTLKPRGEFERRLVTTGEPHGAAGIEVLSGLSAGDMVILTTRTPGAPAANH
jgi:membrane fusion protein (multidrug efflux system)